MATKLSYERYKEEWLKDILSDNSSNIIKGRKFAKKIINDWLQYDDDSGIIYGDQNKDIIYGNGDKEGGVNLGYFQEKDEDEENGPEGDTWYLIQTIYGKAFENSNSLFFESRNLIYALDGKKSLPSLDGAMPRLQKFKNEATDSDRFIFIIATIEPLNEDEKELLVNIKEIGLPRLGQNFDVINVNLKVLFNRLNEDDESKVITVPIYADLVAGDDLMIGSVKLENLYKFLKEYEKKRDGDFDLIYKKNVRMFLGGGKLVNKGIANTIRTTPERFGLYNNGVTIVVEDYKKIGTTNKYELIQPHVVNGCQTTKIIYTELKKKLENAGLAQNREHQKYLEKLAKGILVVKIVKAANDEFGKALLKDTTRYTNSQNTVNVKDFIALEDKFQLWKTEISAKYDFFLEIQKGEYKSKEKLAILLPDKWANAFDLMKIYGASMLDVPSPGTAFGKNSPFAPGGSIFKKIVDNKSFGVRELYAAYLLLKLTKELHFGERGYESKRGKTGYLFCYVLIQLLRDVMKTAGFQTDTNNLSDAIIAILKDNSSVASRDLYNRAISVIEDYMTTDGEYSMSREVKYTDDSNAYLKSDKLGSSDWSPNLIKLLDAQKKKLNEVTAIEPAKNGAILDAISVLKRKNKTERNIDSVAGTKPKKLIILGENYPVSNWKHVLLQTLNAAAKVNEAKLRLFVENNKQLGKNRLNIFRSEGLTKIGLSIETGHSGDTIIDICTDVKIAFGWSDANWTLEYY